MTALGGRRRRANRGLLPRSRGILPVAHVTQDRHAPDLRHPLYGLLVYRSPAAAHALARCACSRAALLRRGRGDADQGGGVRSQDLTLAATHHAGKDSALTVRGGSRGEVATWRLLCGSLGAGSVASGACPAP